VFKKAVFPGKYIQGVGAIGELPALIDLLGKQGLILASPSVKNKVLPGCRIDWSVHPIDIELFRGECCEDELARLSAIVTQKDVDVLVGMGGGKTIDTAKIVADRTDIPVIVIPTIASNEAPCAGVRSVLEGRDFRFHMLSKSKPGGGACGCGYHRSGADTFSRGRDGGRAVDMVRSQVL
jgi:glycerol dehydrogenase